MQNINLRSLNTDRNQTLTCKTKEIISEREIRSSGYKEN